MKAMELVSDQLQKPVLLLGNHATLYIVTTFLHCSLHSIQVLILEAEPLLPPQKNSVYPGTTHLVNQEKAELCHLQKTCNCLFCSLRRMMNPRADSRMARVNPTATTSTHQRRGGWWVDTGNTFPIERSSSVSNLI